MKIVGQYNNRVLAEDDYCFLMSKGIPSIIHGDAAPAVLRENFGSEPICLAVQDEHLEQARTLIAEKNDPEILSKLSKWARQGIRNNKQTIKKKHLS